MSKQPTTKLFSAEAGISIGYASDMLNGNRRMPRPLAIHMYRRTGWKHPSIADLTDRQMKVLESVEPWISPSARATKATKATAA